MGKEPEGAVDLQALMAQLQESPELAAQPKALLHTAYCQDMNATSEDTKRQMSKKPIFISKFLKIVPILQGNFAIKALSYLLNAKIFSELFEKKNAAIR